MTFICICNKATTSDQRKKEEINYKMIVFLLDVFQRNDKKVSTKSAMAYIQTTIAKVCTMREKAI